MQRIRWHHNFFLLAVFDVVVILFCLRMHSGTVVSAGRLTESVVKLDDQARWLQLAEQRVLEIGAPANDVVQSGISASSESRYALVRQNIDTFLSSDATYRDQLAPFRAAVDGMVAAIDELFLKYRESAANPQVGQPDGPRLVAQANLALSRANQFQHEAIRALGVLGSRNSAERDHVLQSHERDLQSLAEYERYFIAAVILILVGLLWFGRRLQQADRALQEERRRVAEERRERLAAIGELCASVAHGIRNPLAAIRSSAQLTLELGQMDETSRRRLRDILEEGQRLGDRVSGLLSMAPADESAFTEFDLTELARIAAADLDSEFRNRGLGLEIRAAAEPVWVRGDHHQLEQVVVELLSNAMDFSQPGQSITLECLKRRGSRQAVLSVEDQGPGVPPEIRERIFDLFFTTKPGGTGVGLATIKRYVRLHGGEVEFTNGATGGAKFVISLQLCDSRMAARLTSRQRGALQQPIAAM